MKTTFLRHYCLRTQLSPVDKTVCFEVGFFLWSLAPLLVVWVCCEICEWFAKTGCFSHHLMVKTQGKWHWFQPPCVHGQWSYDDTETLGSSERNSEDYVSSPLLSEDTTFSSRQNCVFWSLILSVESGLFACCFFLLQTFCKDCLFRSVNIRWWDESLSQLVCLLRKWQFKSGADNNCTIMI